MPQQNPNNATDYSVNQPSIPPSGTVLLATVPAGAAGAPGGARSGGFWVQNQSQNPVYVVLDDGAGGHQTIFELGIASAAPGIGSEVRSNDDPFNGRIRVYSTLASSQVLIRVW